MSFKDPTDKDIKNSIYYICHSIGYKHRATSDFAIYEIKIS